VTGAASGIGRAIAGLFAREGAQVILVDLNEAAARAGAEAIVRDGGRAAAASADVSVEADCGRVVALAVGTGGRLDCVVNAAGIIRRATVVDTTEEDWDRTMAVNVRSIFLMARAAVPVMTRQGGGCLVNIASNWGLAGGAQAAAYCASKGAVVQLTKALAIDHAPQKIRVNCICPGDVDTPMLQGEARELGVPYGEFLVESGRPVPLGRVATPDDIARAALFLAGDAASFMTGTPLLVDGGIGAGLP
jgi:NAD(P)-dependent dehydrogenase (short-subunit alcohol dehydrogenase family)